MEKEKNEIVPLNKELYNDLSIEELEERLETSPWLFCGVDCPELQCGVEAPGPQG